MKIATKSPYGIYRVLQEQQRDGQIVYAVESREFGLWGLLLGWSREASSLASRELAINKVHMLVTKDHRKFAKETVESKRIPVEI